MPRFFLVIALLASLSACSKNDDVNIDSDGDGVINSKDAFPYNPLENQDRDNDGVGDVADVFPDNALESFDSDNDGLGDNSDPDIDGDGLLNEVDEFRFIPLAEQAKIESSDDSDNSYIHNDQLCTVNFDDGQQGACTDRIPLAEAIAASGDANFRQCLNTTLGDISYADEVTHIYCPNRSIAEATGLASFARLKFLNLGNNTITNIDVGNNSVLKQLYMASNQLKGIDTSFNRQLEVLNLNHNLLNTIDIAANTQLTELHLNGNQLQEININTNELLSQLFLRSNDLKLVDVDKNIFLKHLSLGDNNLSVIDITKNIAITHLSLSSNELSEIDVSRNTQLLYVNVNQNKLKTFDASNAPALISLSLVGNQLESVTLNKNQQLNYLNLSNNHLTTIDISQSPQLKTLYLNENQLTMTTIASDIQNIQNTDVKIGLSGNDFSSDTLKALGGLSQLSTPYTGVSYDQNKVLPALLVTENINRAEFTAVPSGVQLSLSASEGEYPVYVAASEEDSFSISNVEQALYFNIQIDDINSEHSFYIVFSDTGEIWNSNNNLIGMLLDTDSEFSNAATLSLGDLSAHDVNETVKVNIYNKTLALSIVKPDTQNDIVVIKLYDAEDPAAEAIYSHSFDASISGANLQAINRVVIYAADALTAPPSKIIQYAQPPIQYNHAPPVPQLRLIAKPGSDQQVVAGDMVTLDASNSVDLDGEIFSYVWSENGTVLSTDKVFNSADFSAGEHIITLTVTNDKGQTSSNILVINALAANNNSPSAPYMLVSGWGGENIEKISTETDTIIETIPVTGCGNLREIDIMPDNKTAYGVCPGLGLYYLNLDSSTVTGSVMVPNNPITAVITSDQSKAYVSQNSYDAAISVIDLASEKITDTISGAQSFGGSFSHLSPDGSKAYLSTNDGANILVIDTTTNALLSPVTTPGVSGMATSPDGATIYAAYFTENAIGIISTDTDSETMRITGVFKPRGLAVSPDGKTLVASSLDSNNISVINLVTQTVTTIDVGTRTICAAFDPKGIKVYICDIDGNAVLPVDIKTKTIGTRIVINDFQPQIISPYN